MANSVLDYMNSRQSKNQENATNAKKQIQEIMEKLQSDGTAVSPSEGESEQDFYSRRYREAANIANRVRQKQQGESIARGQAMIDAQRARDAQAEARNAHTSSELDLAHGILPATSNAQAFAKQHGRSSLDDAVDQIMGNNTMTAQGKVNRIGEEVQNRFGNQTAPEINTQADLGRAVRSDISQNRQTNEAINNTLNRYRERIENERRLREAAQKGNSQRIAAISHELDQEKERQRKAEEERNNDPERKKLLDERGELVDRLSAIEAQQNSGYPLPELDTEAEELRKRLAEYDAVLAPSEEADSEFIARQAMLSAQLDEAKAARYAAIPASPDFKEKSKYTFGNDAVSDRINGKKPDEYDPLTDVADDYLDYFTDEQKGIYNYILNTQGKDEAQKYVENIRPELEEKATNQAAMSATEYGQRNAGTAMLGAAASVIGNPLRIAGTLGAVIDAAQGHNVRPNAFYNRPSVLHGAVRTGVNQRLAEDVSGLMKHLGASDETAQAVGSGAAWLNQGVLSSLDSAWNGTMAQWLTGAFGMDVQGAREILNASKAGASVDAAVLANAEKAMNTAENLTRIMVGMEVVPDAVRNAKARGYTDDQALAVGFMSGLAEWFSEAVSVGNLFETDWTEKGVKNFLLNQLKQRGFEGLEEIESSAITTVVDALIARDKSEWKEAIDKYAKDPNVGKDRAFGAALMEKGGEAMMEALSAFLTTGNEIVLEAEKQQIYNNYIRGTHEAVDKADSKNKTNYRQTIDASIQAAMDKPEEEWSSDLADAANAMRGAYKGNTVNRTIDYLREASRTAGDGISAANYMAMADYLSRNKKAVWQLAEERNGTAKQTEQNAQTEIAPEQTSPSTAEAAPSTESTTPSTESSTASSESTTPQIQATNVENQATTTENQAATPQTAQNAPQTSEESVQAENAAPVSNNSSEANEAQRGSVSATESAAQNESEYRPSERRVGAAAFNFSEDLDPDQAAITIMKRVFANAKDPMGLMKTGVRKAAIDGLNAKVNDAIQSGQYTAEEADALKNYANRVRDAIRNSNTTLQRTLNATSAVLRKYGVKNIQIDENLTAARGYHKGDTIYVNPYLDTMQSIASVVAHETFHQARKGDKNRQLLDDIDKYYSTLASRAQDREDADGQFSISDTGGRVNLYTDAQFVRTYADKIWEEFSPTEVGEAALNAYYEQHRDTTMEEAIAAVYEADPEKFWSDYWKPSESGETAQDYIREEKAANFIEQLAGTDGGALFSELMRDDRNLAQRIVDMIRSFLRLPPKERRFSDAEAYQRLADKFEKALAAASGEEQQRAEMTAATADDIPDSGKFSLSRPVERVGDLIAVHNLTEEKYLSSHKLGGFPAPSIAVVKAKTGHSDYGDISVIFSSDTIDPQKDSRNRIFGGDAWTPMFPNVAYDYDKTGVQNLDAALYKLANSLNAPGLSSNNTVAKLVKDSKKWGDTSIDSVVRILSANRTVQAAYLAARGGTLEAKDHFDAFDELDKKAPLNMVAKWIRPAVEFISDNGSVTVSGKRVPLTAENVVRAMYDNQGSRGVDIYEADANGLRSMAAPEFRSIDEVRQNKDLLERLPDREYQNIIRRMDNYIGSIMDEMRDFNGDRSGLDYDTAILDALREGGSEEDIRYAFDEAGIAINDKLVRDVGMLYKLASQLPTDYFEAKPERVVGFDEVMYYVVPDQVSEDVLRMMEKDGAGIRTYVTGNNKDRVKVLNSLKDVRFSKEINTEQTETDAFKNWFGDWQSDPENASKVVNKDGTPKVVYHGTARGDRVGNVFLPERATSGPMAYFTDSEQIATNYARDKADTSLAYDEDHDGSYESQFRVQDGDKSIRLVDAWNRLKMQDRLAIREAVKHVTWDEDMENIVYDEDAQAGTGGLQDYRFREHRGNAIAALVDEWLNDGNLYGNEGDFMEAVRLAGIPEALERAGLGEAYYDDPNFREEKVYGVYLNIRNPLVTTELDESFADALEKWWDEQDQDAYQREYNRADEWDKNRWDMYDWIDRLRSDIENGTTHVWTSIPDAVTDFLKSEGYDGIEDQGGKFHDEGHTVYIPFESTQIKSATDNVGTFDLNNLDIRYSRYITPELDAEYLEAVESGDTEKQQRMVDEAAKEAGYDIKAYHGTGNSFTVFDSKRVGKNYNGYSKYGKGFYFSSSQEAADNWGKNRKVLDVYLKLENPYVLPSIVTDGVLLDEYNRMLARKKQSPVKEIEAPYLIQMLNNMKNDRGYTTKVLQQNGYDGIVVEYQEAPTEGMRSALSGTTEYVVFDESGIKSADPVTYDNDGNPIPLSERFNPENEDIRYSRMVTPEMDEEYMDAVESGDEETIRNVLNRIANGYGYYQAGDYYVNTTPVESYDRNGKKYYKYRVGVDPKGHKTEIVVGNNNAVVIKGWPTFRDAQAHTLSQLESVLTAKFTPSIGHFVRSTNNKSEINLAKSGKLRPSINHRDGYSEKGVSVADNYAYAVNGEYSYSYYVDGDVIGHGSDGEPLLDPKTIKVVGKLMDFATAKKEFNKSNQDTTEMLNKFGWTDEAFDALASSYRPYIYLDDQIISSDLIMRDDDGNVIPPSQRFNPERADILESRDIETASNTDLRRMLRESEEKVEYLKKQWTARTAFGAAQAVKPEDFNKQVRRLKDMMKYSNVTTDEIRNGLRELYDIMERPLKGRSDTAEARWNEAEAKAEALANEWAIAAAMERVISPDIADNLETLKDIYSKLRSYNGFYIVPEMTAEAGDKESLRRLRKQLSFMHLLGVDSNKAGVASGRMSIDAIYTDLARSYPGFFGEEGELSGGELNGDYAKLQAIADVAGFAWEAAHDPYSIEQTVDEQSVKTQLKDDLLHSFFDVAVPTKASSRPTENDAREAYAQGQAELGAVAESEREEGYREGYNKAKFEDEGAVETAHMREDLMEQRFAEDAERFKNTMNRMLAEREEKINRMEKRMIRRGWADRARIERNGVMRNLNKLNRLLENPTRKQHIPQGLRASTAKLLETVGNTRLPNGKTVFTGRMQQIQADEMEKMRNFAHEIQIGLTGAASAENSNRIASTEGFLLQLADKINALEDYYNRAFGLDVDMSLRTDDVAVTQNYGFLHSLNQILTMAVHALDEANQFTIQGKNYTAENLGSLLVGDLNGRESEGYGRQKRKFAANLSDKLRNMAYETMSADLFFGMMGDNWRNIVAHSYREGQNRQAQHEHQFIEYMKNLLGDYDNMKAKRELIQINANGKSLNVTRSQLMQLYATYQRPAGRTHLENGGACFVDDRGNESRAYTVKITPEKFAELTSHLTDEDKRIADGLVKFMADECSEWGNDASMYMYGFRMYEDGSYIPLDVVNYAIPKEIAEKIQKTKSIENASFTNPLKRNSTVPLRMTDIFDITNNHVRRMAAYNAYAPITNDMNRIMKLSDVSGTVQEKMGRRGYKYLQDFVQTVAANEVRNGEMAESAAPLTTAMNLYKRQAVAWNVSTMLKQPISIFRAANEIDGKYIRQALTLGKNEYQRIKETMLNNSGVAYLKDNGYSDVGLGKTMEKLYTKNYTNDSGLLRGSLVESKAGRGLVNAYDWITEKGMAGAGRADEATWVRIWKACELEVAEKHPGITADEKLRMVTQRFNDVIGKTQVVDTILDTAPLMRNKGMQIFTPFMNEPTKSLGGLVAAADAVRNGRTGAKKALHKAIGLYALSNLLIEPLITSLVSMWRDEKDDTDGFLWSLLEKMFGIKRDEDGDGKNDTTFGSVFISNVAKGVFSFPLINIAYDTISNAIQGFGSEKIDVAALSNLVSSSIALGSNMAKEPDERPKTMYRLWGDWIESAAAAMGIPLKTMRRQVAGVLRGVMDFTNSDWAKWQYNKLYYNLENKDARSQKNFYDILASTYKRGDMETYEKMRKELNDIVTGTPSLVDPKTIAQNIERRGGNVQPGDPLWNVEVQARFRLDTPVKGWHNENFLTGVYKQAESAGIKDDECKKVLYSLPDKYEYEDEDGDDIEMSPAEYDQFASDCGDLAYKLVSQLSSSANAKAWSALTIDQQLYAIEKAYDYSKRKFRKDINPDLDISGMGKDLAAVYETAPMDTSKIVSTVMAMAAKYDKKKDRKKK